MNEIYALHRQRFDFELGKFMLELNENPEAATSFLSKMYELFGIEKKKEPTDL